MSLIAEATAYTPSGSAVASAIKDIMDTQTREIFVNVSSILNNN